VGGWGGCLGGSLVEGNEVHINGLTQSHPTAKFHNAGVREITQQCIIQNLRGASINNWGGVTHIGHTQSPCQRLGQQRIKGQLIESWLKMQEVKSHRTFDRDVDQETTTRRNLGD